MKPAGLHLKKRLRLSHKRGPPPFSKQAAERIETVPEVPSTLEGIPALSSDRSGLVVGDDDVGRRSSIDSPELLLDARKALPRNIRILVIMWLHRVFLLRSPELANGHPDGSEDDTPPCVTRKRKFLFAHEAQQEKLKSEPVNREEDMLAYPDQ